MRPMGIEQEYRPIEDMRAHWLQIPCLTSSSCGDGAEFAHRLDADWTKDIKVAVQHDYAGNQYMTLPVRDLAAPLVTGSRMESVRHAANFECAASVIHDMTGPSSTIANGSTVIM
jgi:N-carbamoyl-L-amino-acid hydrolase